MWLKNTTYIFYDKKHTRNYTRTSSLLLMTEPDFFIHYHAIVSSYSIAQNSYDIPSAYRQLCNNEIQLNTYFHNRV